MLGSRNGVFSILFSENVSLYNLFRGQFGRIYQSKGGFPAVSVEKNLLANAGAIETGV